MSPPGCARTRSRSPALKFGTAAALLGAMALASVGCDATSPNTGSLQITVSPPTVPARITVTGSPSGFSRELDASAELTGLKPGLYTITASPTSYYDGRYINVGLNVRLAGRCTSTPDLLTQDVSVVASSTAAAATVTYAAYRCNF